MVDNLTAKIKAWEIEKGIPFLYDKVIDQFFIAVLVKLSYLCWFLSQSCCLITGFSLAHVGGVYYATPGERGGEA